MKKILFFTGFLLIFAMLFSAISNAGRKTKTVSLKEVFSSPQYSRVRSTLTNYYGITVRNDSLIFTKPTNVGGGGGTSADSVFVTITTDTLMVTDATGADTTWIYDDGDTTRMVSNNNPIKIGDGSVVVAKDGKVSIKSLRVPTGVTSGYFLKASNANGDAEWSKVAGVDSSFSSVVVDTMFIVNGTDTTKVYNHGDTTYVDSDGQPINISNGGTSLTIDSTGTTISDSLFIGTDSTLLYNNPGEIGGNDSYTELLIPSNNDNLSTSIRDTSDNHFTITRHNSPYHSTATAAIGKSSIQFRYSTFDYLTIPNDTKLNIDDGSNFVVDFWYKNNGTPQSSQMIMQKKDGNNTSWYILFHVWGTAYITYNQVDFGISELEMLYETQIIIDGNWHHYAIVRSGQNFYWYIDGTQVFSGSDPDSSPTNTGDLYISKGIGSDYIDGNLDEIRITKGTDRGWTGATIDVPTIEYTEHVVSPSVGTTTSFTSGNEYASVYILPSASVSFATAAATYKTIKPWATDYVSNGITLTDSMMTVNQGGIYLLDVTFSGAISGSSLDIDLAAFVDDNEVTQINNFARWASSSVGYSMNLSGLLQLDTSDNVKIKCKTSSGTTFYAHSGTFTLTKIQ